MFRFASLKVLEMFVFLGIGWMDHYRGLQNGDKLFNGGKYPQQTGTGGEIYNFEPTESGFTYGHVETIKGEYDRKINIERFGARPGDDYVEGVNIVWVATHPTEGGRRVVGFYRNARLYRERMDLPSSKTETKTFRVRCANTDAILIHSAERTIRLGRGKDWMGQAQWWKPDPHLRAAFLAQVLRAFRQGEPLDDEIIELMVTETPPPSFEGRRRLVTHLVRERKAGIALFKRRASPKPWKCEACDFDFHETYGERGRDYIEVHHDIPLSSYPEDGAITDPDKLRFVCANCHRMIHAKADWLSVEELRRMIAS